MYSYSYLEGLENNLLCLNLFKIKLTKNVIKRAVKMTNMLSIYSTEV